MNYFLNLNSKDYFYKKIFFNHLEINYFLNLIETIELIFNFKIDIKNLSLNFSFLNSFLLIEHLIGKKPVLQEVKFIVNLSSKKTNFYNFLLSSVLKEKFKINYILDFWGSLFAMRNLLINNYFLKTYFF